MQRAADADEPPELNFVRKHALAMKAQGLTNPAARLFSNPAGKPLPPDALPTCSPGCTCLPAGSCCACWARCVGGTSCARCPPCCRRPRPVPEQLCPRACHPPAAAAAPAGDYGSMVNERVGASNWEDGDELGNTWVSRNAFRCGLAVVWGPGAAEGSPAGVGSVTHAWQIGCVLACPQARTTTSTKAVQPCRAAAATGGAASAAPRAPRCCRSC